MSEQKILDGRGNGKSAEVDQKHRLAVVSTSSTENHEVNVNDAEAYLYYADITPAGANNVFGYLKNSSDKDMVVNWYRIWSGASAEAIDIYIGATGTPGGTSVSKPSNMNVTSKNEAKGLFYKGTNITGLSGGVLFDRLRLSGDGRDVLDSYPGDIIIQKGGVMHLAALNGSIALEVTLSFYYK